MEIDKSVQKEIHKLVGAYRLLFLVEFNDFQKTDIQPRVAEQIAAYSGARWPDKLEERCHKFFQQVEKDTGIARVDNNHPERPRSLRLYESYLANMKNGAVDPEKVFLYYYWLHVFADDISFANKIDTKIFCSIKHPDGQTYEEKFGEPVPGKAEIRKKLHEIIDNKQSEILNKDDQKNVVPGQHNEDYYFRAIQNEFSDFQDQFLLGYETHDIESTFHQSYKEKTCGYWLLKAGPGMGKSSIIASLARQYAANNPSILYIFRQEFDGSERNNLKIFEEFIFASLRTFYPSFSISYRLDNSSFTQNLWNVLNGLVDEGYISAQKPLYIFVDALDEISPEDWRGDEPNPLKFLPKLPQGVFVTCSIRRVISDKAHHLSMPKGHYVIALDDKDTKKNQIRTAERYVERVCKKTDYIPCFKRGTASDLSLRDIKANQKFVTSLTQKADYNFMILRAVLHDKDYWKNGGTGIDLVSDLEEFYNNQFKRMTGVGQGNSHQRIAYCFALDSSIFVKTFQLLVGRHNVNQAEALLESWLAQGLILKEKNHQREKIRAYHKTFRDFLRNDLLKRDIGEILEPFLADTVYGLQNIAFKGDPADGDGSIYMEWLRLTLTIGIASAKFGTLKELLTDKRVWDLAHTYNGGYELIVGQICRIKYTEHTESHVKDFLGNIAKALLAWNKDNENLTLQVRSACTIELAGKHPKSALDLADFIAEEEGDSDDW